MVKKNCEFVFGKFVKTCRDLDISAFHVGDYKRALLEYEAVSKKSKPPKEVNICLACTYFYLGMYQEAEKAGDKAEKDRLSTRVRFHLSHKFGDEKKLMTFHQGKSYAQYIFTI